MGNDSCAFLSGRNRVKSPFQPGWAYLPSILLYDVFKLLTPTDRLRASSVCRTWRQALYHPSFWKEICFTIAPRDLARHDFFSITCGHLVRSAVVRFNSLSDKCVYELATLLQRMSANQNIRSLMFEPSHCHMYLPPKNQFFFERCILQPLLQILSNLEVLSLGCCENMCLYVPHILQSEFFSPKNIKILGLASMKNDPSSYEFIECDPSLFQPFTKLQILSVDYDYVNDKFLESLREANQLKRLVIHVHGVWDGHPGTSNDCWEKFTTHHTQCELRLTLIHAYEAVRNMHDQILHPAMPLTHLKVFFCENLNRRVFNLISTWYARNFRSIMWVDSQYQTTTWTLIRRMENYQPDPLVMAAWLCHQLEEIVLLGYKYFEDELIGVARLCENRLHRLEIVDDDIVYAEGLSHSKEEISKVLGRSWAPLKREDLHPVISNPIAGDSDEYLVPIVMTDLY